MHKMRTVAIDNPGICRSANKVVCLSRGRANCVKTAEQIDVFWVKIPGDQSNIVLDLNGAIHFPRKGKGGSMRPLPNYFGHLLPFCVKLYSLICTETFFGLVSARGRSVCEGYLLHKGVVRAHF